MMNPGPLTQLGRYQLKNVLGRGAMGMVYEALDPRLERRVAIKTILKSHLLDDAVAEDYSRRFVREAQAAARLNHPHIVTVFDFGEEDEVAYIVMEFIEGGELTQMFEAQHPFTLHEAVRILCELLDALAYAHERGIVHRDIKPANVMIDRAGHVKLTDFGVARLADTNADRTLPGTMVGTPSYMSPEQIQGQAVGSRTDLFAVGVILYQFLTRQRPFAGGGQWAVQRKILHEDPALPSELEPSVPPLFDAIAMRALAKDPDHRFQSARAFADEMQLALSTLPPPPVKPRAMPDPDVTVYMKSGTATGATRGTRGTRGTAGLATAPATLPVTNPLPSAPASSLPTVAPPQAPAPVSAPAMAPVPASMATGSTVPAVPVPPRTSAPPAAAPAMPRTPPPVPMPPAKAGAPALATAAPGLPAGTTPLDWARSPAATWLPPRAPMPSAPTPPAPTRAPRDPLARSPYAQRRPSWRWMAGLAAAAGLPVALLLWRPGSTPTPLDGVEQQLPSKAPTPPTLSPAPTPTPMPAPTPAPAPTAAGAGAATDSSRLPVAVPSPAPAAGPATTGDTTGVTRPTPTPVRDASPTPPAAAPSPSSRTPPAATPEPGSTVRPDRRSQVGAPPAPRSTNPRCGELLERMQLGEPLSPEHLEIYQKECKR